MRVRTLRKIRSNEPLTTGQVAELCCVAPRTVTKWIDNGVLKGFRIPMSRDRRVNVRDLLEFMREYELDLTEIKDAINGTDLGEQIRKAALANA